MHEIHTAKNILHMANVEATERGLATISAIRVRIGAWTGIDIEHLKHDFQTVAPNVRLDVELVEPAAHCEDCGASFEAAPGTLRCSKCGSSRVMLKQKRDIELVSVEAI
jgi:hydrogenase nickel insertion protein HypA